METVGARRSDGTLLIIRDTLICMTLLLCLALLYRFSPALFHGNVSVSVRPVPQQAALPSAPVVEAAFPAVQASEVALPSAPVTVVRTPAAVSVTDLANMETAAAAPAEAIPAEEAPAQALPEQEPAAPALPAGDFSAVFPAVDTGTGALHSFQSDELRIAITKVAEKGVTYFIADVWVKNISAFKTAFAKGEYGRSIHEMPAKIAADNKATFAVSGDYYGARDKGAVVRNGSLYRDVMNEDVCILRYNGTLDTFSASEFSSLQSLDETVWQAWAFGPTLVKDGATCDTSGSKIKVKNPRCAIGFYEPGHYCFLVVDGRQDGYSSGMTLSELSDTFVALGCKAAYNLDGGATAMMVFAGQLVNRPTHGGRASSDIICF